jgi:hypothetical protein
MRGIGFLGSQQPLTRQNAISHDASHNPRKYRAKLRP